MTVKTIYVVRHGYRSNWLLHGPYPDPPTGIDSDFPLAPHGIEQAKQLADYAKTLDPKPELMFSSPFYRCLQTSKPVKEALDIPLRVDRGLGEWYKPDRNIIPIPADVETLQTFFPDMINPDWEPSIVPSSQGETEEEIFERCHKFWPKFIANVERRFPEVTAIMLVTHAAAKAALGMNLLKFPNARMPIDMEGTIMRNGSCSMDRYDLIEEDDSSPNDAEVDFYKRNWKMNMNGNVSYLSRGEEMHWDFIAGYGLRSRPGTPTVRRRNEEGTVVD